MEQDQAITRRRMSAIGGVVFSAICGLVLTGVTLTTRTVVAQPASAGTDPALWRPY